MLIVKQMLETVTTLNKILHSVGQKHYPNLMSLHSNIAHSQSLPPPFLLNKGTDMMLHQERNKSWAT